MQITGIRLKSAFLLVGLGMGIVLSLFSEAETVVAQEPPKFKVDASWPKELPNNWIMGQVGGMAVNVWIGANGPADRQILKFKNDGHFLMQIGHPSTDAPNSLRTDILGRPAGIEVDADAHEVYIADGYMNKRVVVYDSDKGTFKRLWGAYGNPPNDADPGAYNPAATADQQFRNPVHCVHISRDGLVYVCDRVNDRMQVFTKQGKFVKEFTLRTQTLGMGSVWQFAFSIDENQKFLFVDDGENNVIWTVRREDGGVVGQMGHSGRNAGQFHWVHQIVSDSQGNLYTGEVDTGKRIQKFVLLH